MKKIQIGLFLYLAAGSLAVGQTQPWDEPDDHHHGEHGELVDGRYSPVAIPNGSGAATSGIINRSITHNVTFADSYQAAEEFDMVSTEEGTVVSAGAEEAATSANALDIDIGYGKFTVGDTDGEASALGVPYSYKWNDRLRVKASLLLNYTVLKDADFATFPPRNVKVYGGGINISPTYGVYNELDKRPYRWFVTPTVGIMVRNASRIDVGTITYTTGVSSNYYRKVGDRLILNVGNSITNFYAQKSKSSYADLNRRSQQIMVNGVQLIYPYQRWVFSVMAIDNRFIRDSFVDSWQTYGCSAGYRLGKRISLRLYAETDQGKNYRGWSTGISSAWKF